MERKFWHRYIGAHARVHVHFVRRVCMHSDRCFDHHACAGVYVKQVLWHYHTHLRMCVYTHTYTHCTYGVLGCEPRGLDETPGDPEEWTKSRLICIRLCIQVAYKQSSHVYAYGRTRNEILDLLLFPFTHFFFRKRKTKDVNAKPLIISNVK